MSAHTPGPWKAYDSFQKGHASAAFYIRPIGSSRCVAHVKHSTIQPMKANARLIAAAPDLLAALEAISKMDAPNFPLAFGKCVDIANDALAKHKQS